MKRLLSALGLAIATLAPLATPANANTVTMPCRYVITRTWSGSCRVSFHNGRTIVRTGNGHTVTIRHAGLNPMGSHRATIDGATGRGHNDGCVISYRKNNGTFNIQFGYFNDPYC